MLRTRVCLERAGRKTVKYNQAAGKYSDCVLTHIKKVYHFTLTLLNSPARFYNIHSLMALSTPSQMNENFCFRKTFSLKINGATKRQQNTHSAWTNERTSSYHSTFAHSNLHKDDDDDDDANNAKDEEMFS